MDNGWATLKLSPQESTALANIVALAARFFGLPASQKNECQKDLIVGYRPYGIEYSHSPEQPDEMETFSADYSSRKLVFPVRDADNLNQESCTAFDLFEALAEQLTIQLAADLTGRSFGAALRGGLHAGSILQINYSRPSRVRSPFINDEHEDGHFLSLVHTISAGLEIRQADGAFAPASTASDEMLVMPGNVASLMTNGRLPPLFHRVRAMPELEERISILFFADLAPELCDPWIVGDINRAADIARYIRANPVRFGLRQSEPE